MVAREIDFSRSISRGAGTSIHLEHSPLSTLPSSLLHLPPVYALVPVRARIDIISLVRASFRGPPVFVL